MKAVLTSQGTVGSLCCVNQKCISDFDRSLLVTPNNILCLEDGVKLIQRLNTCAMPNAIKSHAHAKKCVAK